MEIYRQLKIFSAFFLAEVILNVTRSIDISNDRFSNIYLQWPFKFVFAFELYQQKILQLTPKNLYWVGQGYLLSCGPGRNTGCSDSLFRSYKIPIEPKSGHRVFIQNSLYLLIVSHPTNQQQYSFLNWEGHGKIRKTKWKKKWIKKKIELKMLQGTV